MATALTNDITGEFGAFQQGNFTVWYTDMDSYMMSLLGLSMASAIASSPSQSSANPSVTLSPSQLENAIAETAARFLWLAGQLGESGGGFQRDVGESRATRNTPQWRLHLNSIPVRHVHLPYQIVASHAQPRCKILFTSIASLTALLLVPFIIGKRPSKEHPPGSLWNERPRVPLARSTIRSTAFAARVDRGASFGQVESSGDV
ncbi:hypothetical protein OG21DRAFT_1326299 [Imleria badia]|nr:hypothetical protein OG21DRAFT_1326299 [Imleria badia]